MGGADAQAPANAAATTSPIARPALVDRVITPRIVRAGPDLQRGTREVVPSV
jgi:hypothetical protein